MNRIAFVSLIVAASASSVSWADKGEVRAPKADDVAVYTKSLSGKGALTATIETNDGTIHCTLFEKEAPMTVANFVGLASGQKAWTNPRTGDVMTGKHFYDGVVFHRVIPGFMIQGGDPLGSGTGGPGYTFANENTKAGWKVGTLAMANAGPDTNGSQFFITDGAPDFLKDGYSIFGQCSDAGVVKKIAGEPRNGSDRPNKEVVMKSVTISRK